MATQEIKTEEKKESKTGRIIRLALVYGFLIVILGTLIVAFMKR